jgi:hypothetical protein
MLVNDSASRRMLQASWAAPSSILRPWQVFDQDIIDSMGRGSFVGVYFPRTITTEATFRSKPAHVQWPHTRVFLQELSVYVHWKRSTCFEPGACDKDIEMQWRQVAGIVKAAFANSPGDPLAVLATDAQWAPLAAECAKLQADAIESSKSWVRSVAASSSSSSSRAPHVEVPQKQKTTASIPGLLMPSSSAKLYYICKECGEPSNRKTIPCVTCLPGSQRGHNLKGGMFQTVIRRQERGLYQDQGKQDAWLDDDTGLPVGPQPAPPQAIENPQKQIKL